VPPRLSVVVPYYNVVDYIGECLESLSRQTFSDFEVILVDDGSTDGSVDAATEHCGRDDRFRIVTQANQGLGPARNTGIGHAQGEYLAFVDSDDIVPPHAYELMVASLDESGSSLAAGDARRFNNASGVRESYLHRIPFAKDRVTTHVLQYPELALDRMAWNKVYRRSFWDEFGFEFPAIRYEDYPVTLKAHLDAVTVDCLSPPVYFWRERESGESITQQKFEYSNLYERVVSAEMVMDLVDRRAPMLRGRVHQHFAQIDLAALVQAFATIPDDQVGELTKLGRRLTDRLDRRVLRKLMPFDRLQLTALESGDADHLRRLAQFRTDGGLRGGARAQRHPVLPWRYQSEYPVRQGGDESITRRLYRIPLRSLSLTTSVSGVAWGEDELILRGTAEIHHIRTPESASLDITMIHSRHRTPLAVERFVTLDKHGEQTWVGFETRIPRSVLAALPQNGATAYFMVDLRVPGVRRTGYLGGTRVGSASTGPGVWISDGVWLQPRSIPGSRFGLRQLVRPRRIEEAVPRETGLTLRGWLPEKIDDPQLILRRSASKLSCPVGLVPASDDGFEFMIEIPWDDLVDPANPDDPFIRRTSRGVEISSGGESFPLLASGLTRSTGWVHRDRIVVATRSPGNYLQLIEDPLRLLADEVTTDVGDGVSRLVIGGTAWAEVTDRPVWRRYLDGADHHVDVPCEVRWADGRWSAAVDMAELLAVSAPPVPSRDPLAANSTWSLYALPERGPAYAVHIDAYEIGRLPIEVESAGGRLLVAPRAGAFQVEVL
jgi:glycosyltransferase involved in cell wall biosynthesis